MRVAASLAVAIVICEKLAAAHDPPHATGIAWRSDGLHELSVVRTNRGLIVSEEDETTFRFLCNEAVGASPAEAEVAPVVFAADGRLFIGSYAYGLLQATRDLCSFSAVPGPLAGTAIVALEPSPNMPQNLFAVAAKDEPDEHLFSSTDDGHTWFARRTDDFLFSLRIAPSNHDRLYASALHVEDGGRPSYRILVSSDSGGSFRSLEIPQLETDRGLRVLAVDPVDPDRAFFRTVAAEPEVPERLLRTDDGARTFLEVMSLAGPIHMTTAEDGSLMWIGSGGGVFRSADHGATFERLEGAGVDRVSCLHFHDDRLFACGASPTAFGVFVSSDQGASFSVFLQFPQVKARIACPSDSHEGRACETSFEDWRLELGISEDSPRDAGSERDAPPHDATVLDGGIVERALQEGACSIRRKPSPGAWRAWGLGAAAAFLGLRWRRSRRRSWRI